MRIRAYYPAVGLANRSMLAERLTLFDLVPGLVSAQQERGRRRALCPRRMRRAFSNAVRIIERSRPHPGFRRYLKRLGRSSSCGRLNRGSYAGAAATSAATVLDSRHRLSREILFPVAGPSVT